jgi:hypothetical protein
MELANTLGIKVEQDGEVSAVHSSLNDYSVDKSLTVQN